MIDWPRRDTNVNLEGETALVVGGTRNIGLAVAKALRGAGANVCVVGGSDSAALAHALTELGAAEGKTTGLVADITDEAAVSGAFDHAEQKLGAVSILVNGPGFRPHGPFMDTSLETWSTVLDIMLTGPFLTCRELFRRLPTNRKGAIVNIGGLSAHRPAKDRAPVIAAKAGIVGLTKALAAEGLPEGSRLMQVDAAALPFEAEYDIVSLFDVLEHTDDDGAVLASTARALKPGGGLLLTVPQHRFLWSHLDELARHRRRYSSRALKAKLRAAGFRIEAAISYQSLLLPVMYLARFVHRRTRHPSDVLRLNRVLNGIFNAICMAERAMIRSHLRLPFGDSLLIVARRE